MRTGALVRGFSWTGEDASVNRIVSMLVFSTLVLAACAPAGGGTTPGGQSGQGSSAPAAPQSLVAAINEDPRNFWDGINGGGGSGSREIGHMVNQYLANILPDGTAVPRLLAELPAVDKGTWT